MKKNLVFFGSSSEVAKEAYKINSDCNIYRITSNSSCTDFELKVKDYIKESEKIINYLNNIENPIIIFFNGFIAENRPIYYPTIEEIEKTLEINFFTPFYLTANILNSSLCKVDKFVYLSSFAATKLRDKNFIYGGSKLLLEKSIRSLEISNYLFIRFGKINTNFSNSHKKTYLDLKKESAAEILLDKALNKSGTIYPNLKIFFISLIIRCMPSKLIKFLKF